MNPTCIRRNSSENARCIARAIRISVTHNTDLNVHAIFYYNEWATAVALKSKISNIKYTKKNTANVQKYLQFIKTS